MQTLSRVMGKMSKNRRKKIKREVTKLIGEVDLQTFANQRSNHTNIVKLVRKQVRPVEDVPSLHTTVSEHFKKGGKFVPGYTDVPLGKQVRRPEDVPSLGEVVLKHFKKKS
ncbi:MAG: hypothetical protein Q8R36_01895 [bacterium]|nr:hypothetical protein [bacterium]